MMRRYICLLLAVVLLGTAASAEAGERGSSGVAYEIFVGSFADSDGDGIGDLRGIEEKLGYIAALGVDMLWLTPIHPSPSYHHYDVTDYYAVAPEFGTMEDFDSLISACGERGISVILDLVVNHTSSEHPWFLQAAASLAGDGSDPMVSRYRFTQGSGQHVVPGAESWYYEGQFGYHMPDLNLDDSQVRDEIGKIISYWQGHGVKGFRLDATTSYYTASPVRNAEFIRFLNETAKSNDPDCYLVGECWSDEQTILGLYSSGIDSLFDFPAADVNGTLIQSTLKGNGASVARRLGAWNEALVDTAPGSMDAPFLTNHDLARAYGMLRGQLPLMKVAAMLYLFLPGRPFVYYGEEIGMSGSGRDVNKRLPMLWSAEDAAQNCLPPADADQNQRLKAGVDAQKDDPDSLLNWYRQLIALRALAPELAHGSMTALDTGENALCAFTVSGEGTVAVLINASTTAELTLDLDSMGLADAEILGCAGTDAETFAEKHVFPPVSCTILRVD